MGRTKDNTAARGQNLMSVRTTIVVLVGVLAGVAVGWWTGTARHSTAEGLLAGAAAAGATMRFFHQMIDR